MRFLLLLVALAGVFAQTPNRNQWRSYDGRGNNVANPTWGSTGTLLRRMGPASYADGKSAAPLASGGGPLPNPRLISNKVFNLNGTSQPKNPKGLTDFLTYWGQFLDHDIDLTGGPKGSSSEPFSIPVPQNDPFFDPTGTGTAVISMARSVYDNSTGTATVRQHPNLITAFIDGSQVYGSDNATAYYLRTLSGGLLRTSLKNGKEYPPLNTGGWTNANDAKVQPDASLYLLGDVRGNENVALLSLHVVFLREHNRLARSIAAAYPSWSDEDIYQEARKFVIGLLQHITLQEYLPLTIGQSLPAYRYNASLDPSIFTEFSTGAFRYGHSEVNEWIWRLGADGNPTAGGHIHLRDAFFNSPNTTDEGVEPILRGMAAQVQNDVDTYFVDDLRNFLFGRPGSGGFDLAAINTNRARDHGIPLYNAIRRAYGLPARASFAEVSSKQEVVAALQSVYASVDDCDVYVCGLAEDKDGNANVGQTFRAVITDQYRRLINGDRFWYTAPNYFNATLLDEIKTTTLADVIIRNTDITRSQIQCFVMGSPDGCGKPVTVNGTSSSIFRVTSALKTPNHPYYGVGNAYGYSVNGVEGANLTLVRGTTYQFLASVSCSHDVYISTDSSGKGAGIWDDGVTGNFACLNNILTFTPDANTPDLLYYQCEYHENMGSRLNIVASLPQTSAPTSSAVSNPASNPVSTNPTSKATSTPTSADMNGSVSLAACLLLAQLAMSLSA